jgi:hypothetical protein
MKFAWVWIACSLCACAQTQTALEQFVSLPGSAVTWSKDIGRLDSNETHLIVTAVLIENPSQTPKSMRGVRIDLENPDGKDRVYIGEDGLDRTRKGFQEIEDGLDRFFQQRRGGGMSCFGSGIFWQSDPRVFPLTGSYCKQAEDFGLYLSAHRRFVFLFQRPGPLATSLADAIAELAKH